MLNYILSLMEFWLKVQQTWCYLEPIFASPDIVKHLAVEAGKFREVDTNWRSMMLKATSNPKVIEFANNRRQLVVLKECHANLEVVTKGLNAFMAQKRQSFPRFFFLSDDELLEILSETKDPERVQPHLKKCFEGINKLRFDDKKEIHGMYSSEDEYIQFMTRIDTNAARGQVDEWLNQVEASMIANVREQTRQAFVAYKKSSRDKWVINRCGMAVLCISMTFWTYGAEELIEKAGA